MAVLFGMVTTGKVSNLKKTSFQWLLVVAVLCLMARPSIALDPNQTPGDNFDLTHWYLTLPDSSATIITPAVLSAGYTNASWFYTGPTGEMVFWCPVTGGTTANSSYPRSELRERLDPTSDKVNWTAFGSHTLTAECKVTQLPSSGKVIIGQIHGYLGAARPLLKFVYNNGIIDAQVKTSPNADPDTHFTFSNVAFSNSIFYVINLENGFLSMTINGVTQKVDVFQLDPLWAKQTFYFKAGSYCQDNSGSSTEGARVAFYQVETSHSFAEAQVLFITEQPLDRSVDLGTNVTFHVAAEGRLPLSFQWRKNGTEIPGETNTDLTIASVQTNDLGNYSVVITNAFESVTSAVAVLTLKAPKGLTVTDGLDATNLVWTTNSSLPWVGETNVTHDGADAVQSGSISNSATTTMQTTVIGPGILSFWWKVSSESGKDELKFLIKGSDKAHISGEVAWERREFKLSSGSQLLQWVYSKNSSKTGGLDRAWVDQVTFIPNNVPTAPIIEVQPVGQTVEAQSSATFSVIATGSTPLSYQWQLNGTNLTNGTGVSGASTALLTLANVSLAQAGNYSVILSNAAGSVISSNAILIVLPTLPLAEALDAPASVWTTSGSPPWVGQSVVMHDGTDAARSGAIGDSKTTSMQTTITGPGMLSFWWKVSSETNKDLLLFYVGSSEKARISGEVNWQRRTISIPAGNQVVKWSYTKSSSSTKGQDRAWVDELRFVSNDTMPEPASVAEALQRANDYYIATSTFQSNGWARGVYQTGNMRAYDVLHIDRYRQFALDWGNYFHWQTGFRGPASADGQVCGQTYIDLYLLDPQPIRIAAVQAGIDDRVAASAVDDWWWIDAFYMGGPVYARFGNLYDDNRYFDKMWLFYQDMKVRRGLFSATNGLWYRDDEAKSAKTDHGQKQFWSRGNGWVIAALARVLEQMPDDYAHRAEFVAMLKTMAAALKPLQGVDGMWRASLLDPTEVPNPETSGTALMTFALAWGIRHDYLDAAEYGPVVARAWNGMVSIALHPEGLVGYAQPQGREPDSAKYDSSSDHGTGAFLLAGSEVYLLAQGTPVAPAARSFAGNVSRTIITRISMAGSKVLLTWETEPDKTYQVLYKDSLSDLAWKPLVASVVRQDSVAMTEDLQSRPQRFYQVVEQ